MSDTTFIMLERVGEFPMPVELVVTFKNGSKEMFYIPTNETLGNKPAGKAKPCREMISTHGHGSTPLIHSPLSTK